MINDKYADALLQEDEIMPTGVWDYKAGIYKTSK